MTYVLIGNGVATIGAIEGIHKHDLKSKIVAIGMEEAAPYGRPLISYLLAGKISADQLALRPDEFYEKMGVELMLGTTVTAIDALKKIVTTDKGEQIKYGKLLIATGGKPFTPPIPGSDGKDIYNFTNIDHAQKLITKAKEMKKAVVIGGGLIGLKAAESLFDRGVEVTILELSPRILSIAFDANAARLAAKRLDEVGLAVRTGISAKEILRDEDGRVKAVHCTDDMILETEAVIIAIGVVPNYEIAKECNIEVDRGIKVNDYMLTSAKDIYAAGDVAQALDMLAGDDRVVPIWTNAYNQGFCAGKNMGGKKTSYAGGLAMNSISFYGLPTVSVGTVNPPDDDASYTVEATLDEKNQSYRKFVFKNDKLEGYVLVGDIDQAGLYTAFIKFRFPLDATMKKNILANEPDVLLWPEQFFDEQWNPKNNT